MTLGVTGVVWLPRTATGNSATLVSGAGPVPLSAAAAAWTDLAVSYADTAATVARVTAELASSWEGSTASAACSRLAAFLAWTQSAAELATESAAKANAQAAAYTTALLVMPSLPEIAAVKATKTAAYGAGGALNGSAQAAEAADTALDIRAALVMEAYEAATSVLAVRRGVEPPPQITLAVGAGTGTGVEATRRYSDADHDVETRPESARTTPAQAVVDSVVSTVQNPATVQSAASQAAHVGTSAVGNVASAVGGVGSSPLTGAGGASQSARVPTSSGVSTATAAAGLGGGLVGSGGMSAERTRGAFSTGPAVVSGVDAGSRLTAGSPEALATNRIGGGAATTGSTRPEDDREIETRYVDRVAQLSDGVAVIPPVIGSDPDV